MKDVKKVLSAVTAIGILQTGAFSQSKFNIYGFMDASVSKLSQEENAQLNEFVSPDLLIGLGRVNTYLDWQPNANTRVLIETQFLGTNSTSTLNVDRRFHILGYFPSPGNPTVLDMTNVQPYQPGASRFTGFNLERAWGEVRFNQYLNFRVGKFITPAGIWNVDHGSPVILTVKQPYQTTTIPIFPVSQTGAVGMGKVFFGDHDLEYSLYISSGSSQENDLDGMEHLSGGGHVDLKLDLPVKAKIGFSGYSGMQRTAKTVATATLVRSVVDLQDTTKPFTGLPHPDEYVYERVPTTQLRENALGVDYRLDFKNFLLQGEVNGKKVHNELQNDDETGYLAWYIIAGYGIQALPQLKITPYLMYEGLGWEDAINTSPGLAVLAAEGWDTYIAGVNVQLYSNVFWKLEYNRVNMRPAATSILAPEIPVVLTNGYSESDLTINTISTQISFAF